MTSGVLSGMEGLVLPEIPPLKERRAEKRGPDRRREG